MNKQFNKMKKIHHILIIGLISTIVVKGQDINNVQLEHMHLKHVRKEINIPDILGYKTLKCDFHIHTIFSDGVV